ncbi:carbohydrate sulfotransferase 11-like [Ruditapes philippinarum]|uniref:carbohydrate sulfotransferase 11-like n=1 Tax=Ruditapes philippinarum TaxID=129788 RepID=UPI00295B1FF1|nr:carbohydrate sulfotransferase 11-like [Ruditapes philippinarum]
MHTLLIERNNLENRLKLNKACTDQSTPQHTALDPDKIQDKVWIERKHSILFCGLPKVGSTFWKRTLTVLASGTKKSPFQLTLGSVQLVHFVDFKSQMSRKNLEGYLKSVSSFLFVRDPYSRLFSGYEHKLYNPNLSFWKSYGVPIVKTIRKNPSKESLKFGHDVTFAEFVQYILKQNDNNERINTHFKPMYQKCDPCGLPYDFIGHLETFKQDAEYLFDRWRNQFSDFNIHFGDFEKETVLDTAKSLIGLSFRSYSAIKSDFKYPFYNLLLRVWSDLQIRGYLSKDIPFPYNQHDVESLTTSKMLKTVSDALEIKVNKTAVKLQRQESLQQAYSTVSLEDMERLRKYVLKDCQLFSYDDRPKLLFDRKNMLNNEHIYMAGI